MKPILALAAIAALLPAILPAGTCGGHGSSETVFVSTEWLAAHLKDPKLVILAIGADEKEFEEAHIPGSLFFHFADSNEARSAVGLQLELPPMAVLARNFAKYGVSDDSRIVLYYLKDWWSATGRVYLTLDAMGLGTRASVLDGNLRTWQAENRPLAAGPEKPPAPGKLSPCVQDDVLASMEYVKSHLHAAGVRILDARDPQVFSGQTTRMGIPAGHIEGAGNVFYNAVLDERGKLKPAAELRRMFGEAGVRAGDRVVTYCFIGQQASALYTVARYLGYDARLYDGSMDEWTRHPELPLENPSRR